MPSPSSPAETAPGSTCLLVHTASGVARVALGGGGELWATRVGTLARGGARELPGLVESLLEEAGEVPSLVASFLGPGSFTGIKVGLAFARGLARARGLELVGIDSLEALASASPREGEVVVAVDALRGECMARRYQVTSGGAVDLLQDLGRVPWLELAGPWPVLVEAGGALPACELPQEVLEVPGEDLLRSAFGLLARGVRRAPVPVWTRPSWAEESSGATR